MRYYEIQISPSDQSVNAFTPVTFSTLTPQRTDNGSALGIELDIFQYPFHQPTQNGYIKIRGIDFRNLKESANYNFAKIKIAIGMTKGLPYANPRQAGLIIDGTVLQSFGNWQGTEVSLDLVVGPANYNPNVDVNLAFEWLKGQTLQSAIEQSLSVIYPNVPINGTLDSALVYTEDQWGTYQNLLQFSKQMNIYSKQIIQDQDYIGAFIVSTASGFLLFDGTNPAIETKNIDFTDLVGMPTWLDIATISIKTIMRSDLDVGDRIRLPDQVPVLNIVNNYSQNRNKVPFSKSFFEITQLRHVGSSRQTDGNSWCTVITAVLRNKV